MRVKTFSRSLLCTTLYLHNRELLKFRAHLLRKPLGEPAVPASALMQTKDSKSVEWTQRQF